MKTYKLINDVNVQTFIEGLKLIIKTSLIFSCENQSKLSVTIIIIHI